MELSSEMSTEHSAGAIIFGQFRNEERKFLLLHYTSGHWDFPKGNIEPGETEKETVKREVLEETGICDIRFIKGFLQPISYTYRRGGMLIHKKVSFYLAETGIKDVKLSHEHVGYLWVGYPLALNKITYKSARSILVLANKYILSTQT